MRLDRWASSWVLSSFASESPSAWCHLTSRSQGMEARFQGGPSLAVTIRMIGFDGRLQWRRHKLFKLRAKLPQRKKAISYRRLHIGSRSDRNCNPHPKFAIRSFLVRRTRNEQASLTGLSGGPGLTPHRPPPGPPPPLQPEIVG